MLERQLVKVNGVISIVFDPNCSRVTLRSRQDLNIEAVGQAIRRTQTMKAFIVTKNEIGEEVLKSFSDPLSQGGKQFCVAYVFTYIIQSIDGLICLCHIYLDH